MQSSRTAGIDSIERRFCFAAWPQTYAHASWFDGLDGLLGLAVSRDGSRAAGSAEQAIAQALLMQAGTGPQHTALPIDAWPLWAMQSHMPMRHHLSIAGALNLLPELIHAVTGDMARQWDSVLGPGVRRAALSIGRTHPPSNEARESSDVRQQALQSARSAAEWDRCCLRFALTASAIHGAALQARVRLAWPRRMQDVEPWPAGAVVRIWLQACLDSVAQSTDTGAPAPRSEAAT